MVSRRKGRRAAGRRGERREGSDTEKWQREEDEASVGSQQQQEMQQLHQRQRLGVSVVRVDMDCSATSSDLLGIDEGWGDDLTQQIRRADTSDPVRVAVRVLPAAADTTRSDE